MVWKALKIRYLIDWIYLICSWEYLYVCPQPAETCFKELAHDPGKKTAGMALVEIAPEDYKHCALMKGTG